MNFTYMVAVKCIDTGKIEHSIDVIGERRANKVADGIRINLSNHFVVTVTKKESN